VNKKTAIVLTLDTNKTG